MKRFFDKFLLGVLWLLSVTLATTFWMNTHYGFDILSTAHWEYLGTLQAHRSEIKPDFYISLIAALFIAILGLYLIVRPRLRHIKTPKQETQKTNIIIPQQPIIQTTPAQEPEKKPNNEFVPRSAPTISISSRPMPPLGLRPPMTRPITTPPLQTAQKSPPVTPPIQNSSEITRALESGEYTVKN